LAPGAPFAFSGERLTLWRLEALQLETLADQIRKGCPFIGCELPQLVTLRSRSPEGEQTAAGGRCLICCRHVAGLDGSPKKYRMSPMATTPSWWRNAWRWPRI